MGRPLILIFALVFVLVAGGCTPAEPEPGTASQELVIAVPSGEAPVIDGTITHGEWSGAHQEALIGGGEIFMIYADGYLYLGVKGFSEPVISVFVDQGEMAAVLHSSAALGTAIYRKGDGVWKQIQGFSWSCRETAKSAQAQAARKAHLEKDGWVASNGRMGVLDEVEFQIAMPEEVLRFAVSSIGAPDYDEIAILPADVSDDCGNLLMLKGPIPDQVQFSPEQWLTVRAEP